MDRILLDAFDATQKETDPTVLTLANAIEATAENVNLEDWPESPMSPSLFSPSWSRRPLQDITNSFNRQDLN